MQGGKQQDLVHIRAVTVAQNAEYTDLRFDFARESGDALEGISPTAYVIDALRDPGRLRIALRGVLSWDSPLPLGAQGAIAGMFRVDRNKDDSAYLYVQLREDIAWYTEETDASLIVHMRPVSEQPAGESWFVTADAIGDYESGALPDDIGLSPTLCKDSSRMLISKPFADEEDAKREADKLTARLVEIGGQQAGLQKLAHNTLPDFSDGANIEALENAKLFEGEGELAFWHSGMVFLGWSPSGNALMARRSSVSDLGPLAELWEYDARDNARQIMDQPLSSIGGAAYAPDGKWLAFTEATDTDQKLYLANLQTGEILFPDDQNYISGFDWGDDGRLYYMGGDDLVYLIGYDPATDIIEYLEDIEGVEGDFETQGGNIVFSDDTMNIYRLNPADGVRVRIAEGGEFRVSPDDAYIACLAYSTEGDFDTYAHLYIMDFETRTRVTISEGHMLGDVCWDASGDTLYYTLFRDGGENFLLDLYAYDLLSGENRALGALGAMTMLPGKEPGTLVINASVPVGEESYEGVYIFTNE